MNGKILRRLMIFLSLLALMVVALPRARHGRQRGIHQL